MSIIYLAPEEEDEDEEPLLSGSGEVERECSEEELHSWQEVLQKWKESQPSKVLQLVRKVRLILNVIVNYQIKEID